MIAKAIEKIVGMVAPSTYDIDGHTYSSERLILIEPPKYKPSCLEVTGLDSICKLVRNEAAKVDRQLFVQIENHRQVNVFSTYDKKYDRFWMYECKADTPKITLNQWLPYERAVIELRSLYIPNEGVKYLINLLGSITNESKVVSTDNGVSQTVEAKSGIALSQMIKVEPRVNLMPFRTFVEVAQPESLFLLRINDRGEIGLFEADGGVWKLEATRNVADYFEAALKDLVESGKVVVIR